MLANPWNCSGKGLLFIDGNYHCMLHSYILLDTTTRICAGIKGAQSLFLLTDLRTSDLTKYCLYSFKSSAIGRGCLVHGSHTGNFSNEMHLARGKHILFCPPMLLLSLFSAACKLGLVGKQTILSKYLFKFKIFQKLAL